jgi:hypothetical protein
MSSARFTVTSFERGSTHARFVPLCAFLRFITFFSVYVINCERFRGGGGGFWNVSVYPTKELPGLKILLKANTLTSWVIGWLVLGNLRRYCVDMCRKRAKEYPRECKEH